MSSIDFDSLADFGSFGDGDRSDAVESDEERACSVMSSFDVPAPSRGSSKSSIRCPIQGGTKSVPHHYRCVFLRLRRYHYQFPRTESGQPRVMTDDRRCVIPQNGSNTDTPLSMCSMCRRGEGVSDEGDEL